MANKRAFRLGETGPAAVFVRVLAFVTGAAAILAIPTAIFAMTAGRLTQQMTLYAVCGAVGLVAIAIVAVRPFDPLRR